MNAIQFRPQYTLYTNQCIFEETRTRYVVLILSDLIICGINPRIAGAWIEAIEFGVGTQSRYIHICVKWFVQQTQKRLITQTAHIEIAEQRFIATTN